jgi:hypothetical protein
MDQSPAPHITPAAPEVLLGWQATSIPVHERSNRWYAISGTILLLGIGYGILSGAWSFSIVLLLCGAMYFLLRNHVPQTKSILIAREGVILDGDFTRYEDLAQFWIIETPHYHELHIASRSRRRGEIVIQTGETAPAVIRATLGQFLEEAKEKRESLIDILIRLCKL